MLVDLPWLDYYLIYGAVAAWVFVIGYFSLAQPPVVELPTDPLPVDAAPAAASGRDGDDPRFPRWRPGCRG